MAIDVEDVVDIYALDDGELETQNRLNNLMWTVSGDYKLNTKLDYAAFRSSKYVAMYDAVKQGGLARYFDGNALALYMLKKIYLGAMSPQLTAIAQLCVDEAVYPKLIAERPGVVNIRREAFTYLLEHRFRSLNDTLVGRVKLAQMRSSLTGDWQYEAKIREPLTKIHALQDAERTDELIRTVDDLYNSLVEPHFVRQHGDLEKVLGITLEEMREDGWKEFLEEEAMGDALDQAKGQLEQQLSNTDTADAAQDEHAPKKRRVIQVDPEAVAKMYSYIEKTFGKSFLSEQEQKALNYRLCRGPHADCALYYTKGVIESPVMHNAQYVRAVQQMKDNQRQLRCCSHVTRQNIETMTAFLKRALYLRTEREKMFSDHGNIIPARLWKVGRLEDPGKLFYEETKRHQNDFAVEVLIDASGSQHDRQAQVAIQAYIISAALSGAKIPHEIVSFCTFWDYTVLQQYRAFDDPKEMDAKVLQFMTSSNNRDGLAISAAGDALRMREEENKILIILSDGKPNDVIVGRPGSRNPKPYTGDYGVKDAALQVRRLRAEGIYVLGVFTGKDEDLAAEKKMFGKDFAYIRDTRNFSKIVGMYLNRLLERDED